MWRTKQKGGHLVPRREAWTRALPLGPQEEPALQTPWSWTSVLLWFKPLSLWCFVTAGLANQYTGNRAQLPEEGGRGPARTNQVREWNFSLTEEWKWKGNWGKASDFGGVIREDKATLMGFPRSHLPNTKVPTSNSAQEEPRKFFVSCLLGEWPSVWVRLVCIWKSLVPTAEGLWARQSWERRFRVCHESEVAQSCPILCDPMDCSLPSSSVHGILQAIILEWVAISFSRGSSQPRDGTQVCRIAGRHFNLWATREARGG